MTSACAHNDRDTCNICAIQANWVRRHAAMNAGRQSMVCNECRGPWRGLKPGESSIEGGFEHVAGCRRIPPPRTWAPSPPKPLLVRLLYAFDEASWRIKAAWAALRHGEEASR